MNNKKSSGQAFSPIIILIGGVIIAVIIAVVIFFVVFKKEKNDNLEELESEIKGPITTISSKNIKISLIKVEDLGNQLLGEESNYAKRADVTTTERFIKIVVGAENIGKEETKSGEWDIGEIVDDEGRKFNKFDKASNWLPAENNCSKNLKPGFAPTLCTKIYEVAKISKDMKLKVIFKSSSSGSGSRDFIDLIGI